MFFRKKAEPMPQRDAHSEAALGVMSASKILPSKRFMDLVYWALVENKQITVDDLNVMANRLSRLAWERGRK